MQTGQGAFKGHRPMVEVVKPKKDSLEEQARAVLKGRTVTDVTLEGDRLTIFLNDGGSVAFSCEGGFNAD